MKKLVVLLTVLMLATACTDSDYRKCVRATAAIASALVKVESANEQLYNQAHLLSAGETILIGSLVNDISWANDEFTRNLRAIKKVDQGNRIVLEASYGTLLDSIIRLQTEGVLKLKEPNAVTGFNAAIAALKEALALFPVLQEIHGRLNIDNSIRTFNHRRPYQIAHGTPGASWHGGRGVAHFSGETWPRGPCIRGSAHSGCTRYSTAS